MCFRAATGIARFLLCIVRPARKTALLGLGVFVGGMPRWQPLLCGQYTMACLQDEWGLPREYGNALELVKGLEENFRSFLCTFDCQQAATEVVV